MKALTKRTSFLKRHKLLVALICLVIAAAVGVYAFYQYQQDQTRKQQITELNNKEAKTDKSSKKDILNKDGGATGSTEGLPEASTSTTSENVPNNPSLSISIKSTSQSAGIVNVSAQTNGTGTCVFMYKPADNGKPVSRQVNVSGNVCSASISQNEFAYLGQWKLTATYYSGGKKAEASQNVTIN